MTVHTALLAAINGQLTDTGVVATRAAGGEIVFTAADGAGTVTVTGDLTATGTAGSDAVDAADATTAGLTLATGEVTLQVGADGDVVDLAGTYTSTQDLLDAISEAQCIAHILDELDAGRGGMLVTPNLDHLHRSTKDLAFAALVAEADLVVADGMPLVWASRLQGTPLPERVAGSNLITTLSGAAAGRLGQGLRNK